MRKLALTAASFSAAIFLSVYILPPQFTWLFALLCAAAGAAVMLIFRKKRIFICLAALAVGFTWFFVHYERTTVPAKALDGYTGEISALVSSYPVEGDVYASVELLVESENSPPLKARIYDYTWSFSELKPGQHVRMTVKLRSADTRYGEEDPYYNSRDLYLLGTYKSDLEITEENEFYLPGLPAYIGRAVSHKIDEIFPSDTAGFMKALLIGDRSDFYNDVAMTTDFSLAGFMHIVAVSGMHVGFLLGFILLILGKSPRSSVISITIIWLFALASGASPSVLRAAFMQTMLLTAPLFGREDDAATTLSFALMVILMFNPYAAASLSLQLSFAAVAGIVFLGEKIKALLFTLFKIENPRSIAAYPIGIAASSIAVLVFTAPLTALYFGYIQILSVITNILGLWAVSLCFITGQIAVLLGFILPKLGMLAAWAASLPARYIFLLVSVVSDIPFAAVYLPKTLMCLWFLITYALFAAFLFSKFSLRIKIIVPTASAFVLLLITLLGIKAFYSQSGGFFTVLDVGQGQCIAAFSGDTTVLVDCGGKSVAENPGKTAGSFLRSHGRTHIDSLIITHPHTDHANGIEQLLELVDADRIIMPMPGEEAGLYDVICERAAIHGTEIVTLEDDCIETIGAFKITFYAPEAGGKDNEDCLILILSLDDYDMLITGDSPAKMERRLLKEHELPDIETLMVAHHGSKYSNTEDLIAAANAETAIISVGYNSYGHPTEEVLERLADYGYNIYRTDENGNIQIWVDVKWPGKTIRTSKN